MSTKKKLTSRQLEVLKLLNISNNKAIFHPLGHWYMLVEKNDLGTKCTRQIETLLDCGFVRSTKWLGKTIATISSEGEKYLEENLLIKGKGTKL